MPSCGRRQRRILMNAGVGSTHRAAMVVSCPLRLQTQVLPGGSVARCWRQVQASQCSGWQRHGVWSMRRERATYKEWSQGMGTVVLGPQLEEPVHAEPRGYCPAGSQNEVMVSTVRQHQRADDYHRAGQSCPQWGTS